MFLDFVRHKTQADNTNLTPSTENGITNVLYGYDPEDVLLASAKSVAVTEARSKLAQQNSFAFNENASTTVGSGEVSFALFVWGTDREVSGLRGEVGTVSDSLRDLIASAAQPLDL